MPQLVDRFSVSLDTELLAAFDALIADRGYDNRSEAVRDLLRNLLLEPKIRSVERIAAFATLVCDHSVGEVGSKVRRLLSENPELVRGVLELPIDGNRQGIAVALFGRASDVNRLADSLQSLRGVTYGRRSAFPIDEATQEGDLE